MDYKHYKLQPAESQKKVLMFAKSQTQTFPNYFSAEKN